MTGACIRNGKMRNVFQCWLKNLNRRAFRISGHRWEDNIGMDLKGMGWEGVDRNHVAQDTE
jgi:hypothetical protein